MGSTKQSESRLNLTDPVIPVRVAIGVTGHRKLENHSALSVAIQSSIKYVRQMIPPLKRTPLLLCILSPLAEGADRLVAKEIIKIPGSILEVVLPLQKDDYIQDFETVESKAEFEELISKASNVKILTSKGGRAEAYEQVGRYIVDQCDVLIALWDGEEASGKGGTQEIVQYARDTKCPLVWIHTKDPIQITVEPGRSLSVRSLHSLDDYNSERVKASKYEKQFKKAIEFFTENAERAGLPFDRYYPILEYILQHYIRIDILALRYQHWHYRVESLLYTMAFTAVFIASFQNIFLPKYRIILVSEVVLMLGILAIIAISNRQKWHNKWIDYRFLAERLRSSLFLALADIEIQTLRPPRHLSLAYSPEDWMIIAFFSIWRRRPRLAEPEPYQFKSLESFILKAWIQDQIHYHESTKKRHYRRYLSMNVTSYVMFGLTILVTILFIVNISPFDNFLSFAATVFPAIAASITAIQTQRDYLRNSMRSSEMARHLEEIRAKMMATEEHSDFLELLKETEETMLHENEDWRVVVRFHTPEIPI
jgi:hypothetical protein